jgi:hypothetical protein
LRKLARLAAPLALVVLTAAAASADEATKVDRNLPAYKKVDGVRGNLSSIGSDTRTI